LMILMFIGLIFVSVLAPSDGGETAFSNERIVYLVLAGLGFLFLGIYVGSGLSTGSTLFSMSDVGYLFTAPISPKKILLYGLINTLGKSLFSSIFIFYQIVNLRLNFGYGSFEIIALFVIYTVILIIGQLLAIAIYLFTNGNPSRKRGVKAAMLVGAIGLAIGIFSAYMQEGREIGPALLGIADARWFGLFPIGGWAVMFFRGISQGIVGELVLSSVLFIGTGLLVILALASGKADYYEDVLVSTEKIFNILKDAKEKKTAIYSSSSKKKKLVIKEKHTLKGTGVKAIAYRQLLEIRRRNRIPFINVYTIIASLIAGIVGYNTDGDIGLAFGLFAFLAYMQFFLTLFNPLNYEIKSPYIYMIPETSRKKVLAASLISFIKPCVDGLIIFAVFAAVGGTAPLSALLLAIGYAAVGSIYLGVSILNQRVIEGQPNIFLKGLFAIVILIVVIVPAVVSFVLTATFLPEQYIFFSMLPFSLYCFLLTSLIFALTGDVLDKSELK
ncbi:MAG TPA: putative ABC exporter domain-containing protein, partial [Bacillota bacterium]|nr:putative ABC exporter domain-containing protein [Bacillota bacterium]